MDTTKFTQTVKDHQGVITADNQQGMYRVEFTSYQRMAGFYDNMISRLVKASIERRAVVVQL